MNQKTDRLLCCPASCTQSNRPLRLAAPRSLPLLGARAQHAQLGLPHAPRARNAGPGPRHLPAVCRPQAGVVPNPPRRVGERLVGAPQLEEVLRGLGAPRRRAHVGVVPQRQPPVRALDLLRAHVRPVLQGQHLVVVPPHALGLGTPSRRRRCRRHCCHVATAAALPAKDGGGANRGTGSASHEGDGAGAHG